MGKYIYMYQILFELGTKIITAHEIDLCWENLWSYVGMHGWGRCF